MQSEDDQSIIDQVDLKFVIASTPRSGTTFVSNVLNKLQVRAGHEGIFQVHGVAGALRNNPHIKKKLEGDVSGFVNPYLKILGRKDIPVYHLIRHPVPSINSLLNFFQNHGQLQIGVLSQPLWLAMAELWHYWHRELDQYCSPNTLRLENISEDLEWFAGDLSYDWSVEQIADAIEQASRGTSVAMKPQHITWDMLPKHIQEFAYRFDYKEKE